MYMHLVKASQISLNLERDGFGLKVNKNLALLFSAMQSAVCCRKPLLSLADPHSELDASKSSWHVVV